MNNIGNNISLCFILDIWNVEGDLYCSMQIFGNIRIQKISGPGFFLRHPIHAVTCAAVSDEFDEDLRLGMLVFTGVLAPNSER